MRAKNQADYNRILHESTLVYDDYDLAVLGITCEESQCVLTSAHRQGRSLWLATYRPELTEDNIGAN